METDIDKFASEVQNNHGYATWSSTRVQEGVSTSVYLLEQNFVQLFLRILGTEQKPSLETFVHTELAKFGVPVPKVLFHHDADRDCPHGYMIVEHIGGSSLEKATEGLDQAATKDILRQAGKAIAVMQAIPIEGYEHIASINNDTLVGRSSDLGAYIAKQKRDLDHLEALGEFNVKESAILKGLLQSAEMLFQNLPPVFAHGDMRTFHIFCQDSQFTGFIDFGGIRGASTMYDLANFKVFHPKFFPYLLEGYLEHTTTPDNWRDLLYAEAAMILIKKNYRHLNSQWREAILERNRMFFADRYI